MNYPFFCSDVSRQVGKDLIGSATPYQVFILVECPFPWKPDAFDSKWIPPDLRDLVVSVKASRSPIRFLLVNQSLTQQMSNDVSTRVLIYQRTTDVFCQGYQRYEWLVNHPKEIAPLIQSYLQGQVPPDQVCDRPMRDLLVCVHGSHDKCCGKHGFPFYRQAIATIDQIKTQPNGHPELTPIRLWQTSHFGGHRFAPTLIDFPTGRYYGRMGQAALQSILMRSGHVQLLNAVYRGWSVLPTWLQAVERELMFYYGWEWFDTKIAYQLIAQSTDDHSILAKLWVLSSDERIHSYAVEVMKAPDNTVCLRISCGATQESEQVKYVVKSLDTLNPGKALIPTFHQDVYKISQ